MERKENRQLRGPRARIHRLAISTSGTVLASADVSGGIHLWDLVLDKKVASFQDRLPIFGLCFSPDEKHLVFGNRDGEISVLDLSKPDAPPHLLDHKVGHQGEVRSIAFSPDGKTLATGGEDGVRLWQWATGHELLYFGGLPARVNAVSFSPDGEKL